MVRTRIRTVVVDPEVVFVASLMKADAPALVASFQCDFTWQADKDATQKMTANLRDLKILACPFIQDKGEKTVTTVSSNFTTQIRSIYCETLTEQLSYHIYCDFY